jgi:hypothetical protein
VNAVLVEGRSVVAVVAITGDTLTMYESGQRDSLDPNRHRPPGRTSSKSELLVTSPVSF